MTLELTTSWEVRGHDTSAEIAKYRLKGVLHIDRSEIPSWHWSKVLNLAKAIRFGGKPIYRLERRT